MKKIMINYFMAAMLFSMAFAGCDEQPITNGENPVITLNKEKLNINVSHQDTIIATVTPHSDTAVVWSSSDESIATVFYGIVTAKFPGTCDIIATCGSVSATCAVHVYPTGVDPNDSIVDDLDGYTLFWSDEFNNGALNSSIWNMEINGNGGGNNELEYYTNRPQNVSVGTDPETGEGCMILTAIKENYSGKTCTSGRVNTRDKFSFEHGLIEARIKIPYTADGLWPAFWMMGADYGQVGWPRCGEIDIMEMGSSTGIHNGTQDRYFGGWMHWGIVTNGNHPNSGRAITNSYSVQGSYHTFRMYWDESQVKMYLDKDIYPSVQPYMTMNIPASDDDAAPGKYFHKPFFIIFNLAVGGNYTGISDINNITALNADNNYTSSFYIDYVRVYQKNDN